MFAWVILHYQAIDATMNEVKHIQKISCEAGRISKIIIVDNASPNGSGKELRNTYKRDSNVTVLCLPNNVGFAKGNNAGYLYALKLKPNFIVVTNNDIEVKQSNLFEIVENDFSKTDFAVMGPDIYVPATSLHQNPKGMHTVDPDFVRKQVAKNLRLVSGGLATGLRARLKQINWLRKLIISKRKKGYSENTESDVVLHGSFVVLSPVFFNSFRDWAFYPETFFYYEMEIQFVLLRSLGLGTLYDPAIQVNHFQGISTSKRYKQASEKLKFQSQQMAWSGRTFLDVYEKIGKGEQLL
jgi:GT2 family glycosyltransferase